MTICVAVKVHDCIVFAADSAISTDQIIQNDGYAFQSPAPLRSATPGPFRSEGGARAEERARRCAFRALRPP